MKKFSLIFIINLFLLVQLAANPPKKASETPPLFFLDVTGSSESYVGGTTTYTANWTDGFGNPVSAPSYSSYTWSATGGTVTNQSSTDCIVTWGTAGPGNVHLSYTSGVTYTDDFSVSVYVAPTATPASSITSSSFTANWTSATGANFYYLDVSKTVDFSTYVSGFPTSSNGTSYNVTNLEAGTIYYYRVRAHSNTFGNSGNSNTMSMATIPAAPTANAASSFTTTSFTASWSSSTGATAYNLDVSKLSNFLTYISGYENTTINETNATITGLTPGTTYYYRVRAINGSGESVNSNTVTTITIPNPTSANSASSITSNSFTANWNSQTGASSYKVYVSTDIGFSSYVSSYSGLDVGNVTSASIGGLSAGTPYYYRIVAANSSGSSSYSNTITVITIPPAPPAYAADTFTQTSFTANWGTSSHATSYNIYVSPNNGFTSYVSGYAGVNVGNVTSISISGLSAGTPYFYKVSAVNGAGESAASSTIETITIPPQVSVSTASSITQISFTGNWVAATGATAYKVYVSLDNFSTYVGSYNGLNIGNFTNASITGLSAGTPYYFKVRALNSSGESTDSNVIIVTTIPPNPVTTAANNFASNSFDVHWQPATGVTYYKLYVSQYSNFSSFVSPYSGANIGNVTTATVPNLSPNTTYYYKVRAVNGSGESSDSNTSSGLTKFGPTTATAATNISVNSFTANWTSVAGATGYRLDVSTDAAFVNILPAYNDYSVTQSTLSVTGLANLTRYYYRVRVVNASGSSINSNPITVDPLPDLNYVRTFSAMKGGFLSESQLKAAPTGEVIIQTEFMDGLGRPIQSVATQQSPTFADIVQPVVYDQYGRETVKYLPFTTASTGWYNYDFKAKENANYQSNPQYTFYQTASKIAHDTNPYLVTTFEPSPLNRVTEQGAPGESWQPDDTDTYATPVDRSIKKAYEFNADNEVLLWTVTPPDATYEFGKVNAGTVSVPVYYAANQLMRNRTKDEAHHEVVEYVDKQGRTILKRVQAEAGSISTTDSNKDSNYASTYYIYDDFGNLVCVIPPEATKRLTAEYLDASDAAKETFLNQWAFRYTYDARKRMSKKQVPGAEPVYMVYDNRDRLILSQDGNQRPAFQWSFTKYDQLNRPVMTGIYTHGSTASQSIMSGNISTINFYETFDATLYSSNHGYSNTVFPINSLEVHTVSYYDTYDFRSMLGLPTYVNESLSMTASTGTYTSPSAEFGRVQGLATGSRIKVLDGSVNTFLNNITYYDDRYRVIQVVADQFKGGVIAGADRISTLYNFSGQPIKLRSVHLVGTGSEKTITRRMEYDHAGRLLLTFHQVGIEDEILLTRNTYNELGQLVIKDLHSTNYPEIDYSIGQPGVTHAADIQRSSYSSSESKLIAGNSITLSPGYIVPSGSTLQAKIGYTQQEAAAVADASSSTFKQSIDYRYNIHGWLTKINDAESPSADDYFNMNLKYHDPTANGGQAQFNGNISELVWKGTDTEVNSYGYSYDPMNRLTEAKYYNSTATKNDRFNEKIWDVANNKSGYDLNGNIKFLTRGGKTGIGSNGVFTYGTMDNLAYTYTSGNQLAKVDDGGVDTEGFKDGANVDDDYVYDDNGSMRKDKNKDIDTIAYNHLNLPKMVIKTNGEYVKYVYDATGRKLRQEVYNSSNQPQKSTDYAGEFIYENNALQFINHEEGRVIPTGNEYQYHLKDHLGNVRTTFTTVHKTEATTATYEPANVIAEQGEFLRYTDAKLVNSTIFDRTNGSSTGYAQRLNGTDNEKYGLAKSISVMPGDTINVEVYAKYVDTNAGNWTSALSSLMSQIAANTTGVVVDGPNYPNSTSTFPFAGLLTPDVSGSAPKAYLNWLVFDRDYNLQLAGTGYKRMTETAKESGQDAAHERLYSPDIIITEPGYVYIYLSNEEPSNAPVEVYFDDLKVTHTKSPVVQMDDYYPFGLTFNSHTGDNNVKQDYLYNGKELQDELSIGWLDYGMRMYQPELGRFFTQDRFAEKYSSLNPYQYAANNPVLFIDINGDSVNVAEKYREQFGKALESIFGTKSSAFSYSSSGNLIFNGDTGDFSEAELSAFNDLNGIMSETTLTNVVFEKSYTITDNDGNKVTIDPSKSGGEGTALVGENNISENYVVIDPAKSVTGKVFEVTEAYYNGPPTPKGPPRFNVTSITTSVENRTLHGLGHVIHRGRSQDNVIDFDNKTRVITKYVDSLGDHLSPLPMRNYDETHNRTVTSGQYGN